MTLLKKINRTTLVLLTVVLTLLATVSIGLASDGFSDVPNSHPFHDQIGDMAASCVSTGYSDGTYRPSDEISRQAMAAFLSRGLTRAYQSTTVGSPFEPFGDNTDVTLATMDITTPDVGGGCSFDVHLTGWASLLTNETYADACNSSFCNLNLELRADGSPLNNTLLRLSGDDGGGNLSLSHVHEQAAGTTVTYTLVAGSNDVADDAAFADDARAMTAIVAPDFD